MIIPVLVVFGFFITLPALIGAFFSFTNYAGYGDWEFIGLNNYINIFHDPTVLQPYLFTFFLAIVVHRRGQRRRHGRRPRTERQDQVAHRHPRDLLHPDGDVGADRRLRVQLPVLHLAARPSPTTSASRRWPPASWPTRNGHGWRSSSSPSGRPHRAPSSSTWPGCRPFPTEIYEAGSLDGAGAWRQFRSLTLPLMLGYLFINIILGFKGFLGAYEIIVGVDRRRPRNSHHLGRHEASSPGSPAATTPTRWPMRSSTS